MTEPGRRHTKSARIWDGTWEDLGNLGKDEGFAPSTLVGDTADVLAGYIRCSRCSGTPVSVHFGNLSGRPLRDWITEATIEVHRQRCKDHRTVLVGAETATQEVKPAAKKRARHDRIVELSIEGHSTSEIAETVGLSPGKVRAVVRQRRGPAASRDPALAKNRTPVILGALAGNPGGMSTVELLTICDSDSDEAGPSRESVYMSLRELEGSGRVERAGSQKDGSRHPLGGGMPSVVWRITDKGRRSLERYAQPPGLSGTEGEAATKGEDAGERTEPPAPAPAKAVEAEMAERNAERRFAAAKRPRRVTLPPVAAESTPAATAARLASEVPGVALASELPAPRPGTLAFKPPVDEPHLPPVHEVPAVPPRSKPGLTTPHAITCKCGICKPAGRKR